MKDRTLDLLFAAGLALIVLCVVLVIQAQASPRVVLVIQAQASPRVCFRQGDRRVCLRVHCFGERRRVCAA